MAEKFMLEGRGTNGKLPEDGKDAVVFIHPKVSGVTFRRVGKHGIIRNKKQQFKLHSAGVDMYTGRCNNCSTTVTVKGNMVQVVRG